MFPYNRGREFSTKLGAPGAAGNLQLGARAFWKVTRLRPRNVSQCAGLIGLSERPWGADVSQTCGWIPVSLQLSKLLEWRQQVLASLVLYPASTDQGCHKTLLNNGLTPRLQIAYQNVTKMQPEDPIQIQTNCLKLGSIDCRVVWLEARPKRQESNIRLSLGRGYRPWGGSDCLPDLVQTDIQKQQNGFCLLKLWQEKKDFSLPSSKLAKITLFQTTCKVKINLSQFQFQNLGNLQSSHNRFQLLEPSSDNFGLEQRVNWVISPAPWMLSWLSKPRFQFSITMHQVDCGKLGLYTKHFSTHIMPHT